MLSPSVEEDVVEQIEITSEVIINQNVENNQQYYIGNINSKKFHKPSCDKLPDMENQIELLDREQAISEGFEPCKLCNP